MAVRHRLPVLAAEEIGAHVPGPAIELRPLLRILDRTPGRRVDAGGPVHVNERLGREQPAVLAIENVEEAVAIGLQERRRHLSADVQIGHTPTRACRYRRRRRAGRPCGGSCTERTGWCRCCAYARPRARRCSCPSRPGSGSGRTSRRTTSIHRRSSRSHPSSCRCRARRAPEWCRSSRPGPRCSGCRPARRRAHRTRRRRSR